MRQGKVILFLFVRCASLCYTTRVAIIEGKSSTEDADFDISKLALVIQSGTILLGGDSPPSLRREMAVSLSLALFLLFFPFSSFDLSLSLSRSVSRSLSRSLGTCPFLVSQCKWKANRKRKRIKAKYKENTKRRSNTVVRRIDGEDVSRVVAKRTPYCFITTSDISKLALTIQSGTILLRGGPPLL